MIPQLLELRSNEQTDEPSRSVTSHAASKQNTLDHGVFSSQKAFLLMNPSLIAPPSSLQLPPRPRHQLEVPKSGHPEDERHEEHGKSAHRRHDWKL